MPNRRYNDEMADSSSPVRKSILESPWYWVYAFCAAALVALLLVAPKFGARQAQIERQYQGRQRAAQQLQGRAPTTPLSTQDNTSIRLWPLYTLIAAAFIVSWLVLWFRHFGRRQAPEAHGPGSGP